MARLALTFRPADPDLNSSRDQSIRSRSRRATSVPGDALRTARLEDSDRAAESSRQVREAIQVSARLSIDRRVADPPGRGARARQPEQVEQHIAATFEHLNERDEALTRGIQERSSSTVAHRT
jgi:hypothetical protein